MAAAAAANSDARRVAHPVEDAAGAGIPSVEAAKEGDGVSAGVEARVVAELHHRRLRRRPQVPVCRPVVGGGGGGVGDSHHVWDGLGGDGWPRRRKRRPHRRRRRREDQWHTTAAAAAAAAATAAPRRSAAAGALARPRAAAPAVAAAAAAGGGPPPAGAVRVCAPPPPPARRPATSTAASAAARAFRGGRRRGPAAAAAAARRRSRAGVGSPPSAARRRRRGRRAAARLRARAAPWPWSPHPLRRPAGCAGGGRRGRAARRAPTRRRTKTVNSPTRRPSFCTVPTRVRYSHGRRVVPCRRHHRADRAHGLRASTTPPRPPEPPPWPRQPPLSRLVDASAGMPTGSRGRKPIRRMIFSVSLRNTGNPVQLCSSTAPLWLASMETPTSTATRSRTVAARHRWTATSPVAKEEGDAVAALPAASVHHEHDNGHHPGRTTMMERSSPARPAGPPQPPRTCRLGTASWRRHRGDDRGSRPLRGHHATPVALSLAAAAAPRPQPRQPRLAAMPPGAAAPAAAAPAAACRRSLAGGRRPPSPPTVATAAAAKAVGDDASGGSGTPA